MGLALGAAAVIAMIDGDDVFGIFAANGLTELVWGIAAAILLVLALLPRVGGDKQSRDTRRFEREPRTAEGEPVGSHSGRVAGESTPESRVRNR